MILDMPSAATPAALQPLPENTPRPPRPACFTNRGSAVAYMWRAARMASPSGEFEVVPFLADTFRPIEGGEAFHVSLGRLDWEVTEISAAEVERRVQAAIRRRVDGHTVKARAHELAAGIAKSGSCFERMHLQHAAGERSSARELELLLTVAVAS